MYVFIFQTNTSRMNSTQEKKIARVKFLSVDIHISLFKTVENLVGQNPN